MSDSKISIRSSKSKWSVVFFTIASVVILSLCLPGTNDQSFEYEVDKPWHYPMLTAPFDIPIENDSATAKAIKDSINSTFIKIYRNEAQLAERQIDSLGKVLAETPTVKQSSKQSIKNAVENLYNDGIVDNATYNAIETGRASKVRFLEEGNVAKIIEAQNMKSVRAAYASLDTILNTPDDKAAMQAIQLDRFLVVNIVLDSAENKRLLEDAYANALAPRGMVQTGERIINQGDIVTPQKNAILQSYERILNEKKANAKSVDYNFIGKIVLMSILMLMFYFFMMLMRPNYFANTRMMLFLISTMTLFAVLVFILIGIKPGFIYVVPFALLPIIVTTFTDSRLGFFSHLIVILICSLVVDRQAEFIILQFFAGFIAISAVQELNHRSQLVKSAAMIFLAYSVCYVALYIIRQGSIDHIGWHTFLYFAVNCVVLSFAYFGIFLVEKIFGFTSSVTLVELADINSPTLRELSQACPGTFQHSLQLANLAQECAHRIGADVQLVRAGSLYHDIGKIENPAFFTENQSGVNPHDNLTPEQSASILINHVKDGLRLAEKANLPKVVKDMIAQHHGKGVTRYFLSMARKNAVDNEQFDTTPFTYPGPNPQTREAAIIMMADACEAAAKSLESPDEQKLTSMVNKIIDNQIAEGLLNESPISFKDIMIVKSTLIERLKTFYHLRVSYPDEVKPKPDDNNPAQE